MVTAAANPDKCPDHPSSVVTRVQPQSGWQWQLGGHSLYRHADQHIHGNQHAPQTSM